MININIQKNIDGNDYYCLKCDKIYNFKLEEKAKHIHECFIPLEEYFTKKDVLKIINLYKTIIKELESSYKESILKFNSILKNKIWIVLQLIQNQKGFMK